MSDRLKIIEYIYETMPIVHKKLLSEIQFENYSKHQLRLLMMIKRHEGRPMKFYCHMMMMNKSNLSNLVRSLIDDGLVESENSIEDRRINLLHVTDQGNVFLNKMRAMINETFLDKINELSDEDMKALDKSFTEIRRIFEKIR
jgi:DNA-binding MarR family transcriptional regulator